MTITANKKRIYGNLVFVSAKICRVTCSDLQGIEHTVEVTAESLFEAVARGMCVLRKAPWADEFATGFNTVTVVIKQDEVRHTVKMQDFNKWVAGHGRTPADITARQRRERFWRSERPSLGIALKSRRLF